MVHVCLSRRGFLDFAKPQINNIFQYVVIISDPLPSHTHDHLYLIIYTYHPAMGSPLNILIISQHYYARIPQRKGTASQYFMECRYVELLINITAPRVKEPVSFLITTNSIIVQLSLSFSFVAMSPTANA
jgi:hypothetical protein